MTTMADMITLVNQRTGRPDLLALTQTAIRTATIRAHSTDFFPRDGARAYITYTPDMSTYFVDIPGIHTTLAQLRAVKSIYCVDSQTNRNTEKLDYRTVGDEYDSKGVLRQSIYVIHGSLRIYPIMQTGKLDIGYFMLPVVSDAGYSSWIADMYADDLAAWAAAIVHQRMGSLEIAQALQRDFILPFKELLVESHMLSGIN